MSWLAIIGVILQILQAAGVFDWLVKWIEQLLSKWRGVEVFGRATSKEQLHASVYRAFDETRPGWRQPVRRLAHGLCRSIVLKNSDLLWAHTFGPKAGLSVNGAEVDGADPDTMRFLNSIEGRSMHDDFVSMVNDLDASFPDDGKVGADTTGAFFDGTILNIIRGLKGLAGAGEWIKWVQVALQLIAVLGPKVDEIIEFIKKAIKDLKTPNQVLSDLIVAG